MSNYRLNYKNQTTIHFLNDFTAITKDKNKMYDSEFLFYKFMTIDRSNHGTIKYFWHVTKAKYLLKTAGCTDIAGTILKLISPGH